MVSLVVELESARRFQEVLLSLRHDRKGLAEERQVLDCRIGVGCGLVSPDWLSVIVQNLGGAIDVALAEVGELVAVEELADFVLNRVGGEQLVGVAAEHILTFFKVDAGQDMVGGHTDLNLTDVSVMAGATSDILAHLGDGSDHIEGEDLHEASTAEIEATATGSGDVQDVPLFASFTESRELLGKLFEVAQFEVGEDHDLILPSEFCVLQPRLCAGLELGVDDNEAALQPIVLNPLGAVRAACLDEVGHLGDDMDGVDFVLGSATGDVTRTKSQCLGSMIFRI